MTTYINKDGNFRFKKASEMIVDITDGYLSNKQNVDYARSSTGWLELSEDNSEDENHLASRLLSTLSQVHSIITDHTICGQDKDENLERLERFTTILSKLSDRYSQKDQIYAESFHSDVIDICQAIKSSKKNL